ncbi:hypothetical protein [Plantactinospora sp. WMMB782]|uniref:hypothetical protein n=1 Tax=Plantactinospora sp. WMMB782 TaxID=3404121 RepID=UPI003B9376D0
MSEPVTVHLPEDVATRLQAEPDADAYVAEAIRQRMAREQGRQMLIDQGFNITDEGVARARARLAEADRKWTPERRRQLRERMGWTG